MRQCTWLAVGLLLVVPLGPLWAEDGPEEVKLKASEIKASPCIISKSDVGSTSGVMISKGALLPRGMVKFTGSVKEGSLTLGGEKVLILLKSGIELEQGGKSRKLKKVGSGLDTQDLKLESGLKYALAFPYADTGRGGAVVYYRAGCQQSGKLNNMDLALYDDNTDGQYTSSDTFSVDGSLAYAPLGTLLPTASAVYKVGEMAPTGETLTCSKYEGETGKISVKFSGKGVDGHFAFGGDELNLTSTGNGKSLTVVPGSYKLLYGVVMEKDKAVAAVSLGDMEAISVEAGKEADVSLGKPFTLIFPIKKTGDNKVSIEPWNIKIKGKAGEVYTPIDIQGLPIVSLVDGKKRTGMGSFETG